MQTTIGLFLIVFFLFLAGIHFYWGLGGKQGLEAAIPENINNEKTINPGIVACFTVGFGLCFIAVFILIRINIIGFPLPSFIQNYSLLFLALLFGLRAMGDFKYAGFTKKVHHTKFAQYDTRYYSPLCLLLGLLFTLLNYL